MDWFFLCLGIYLLTMMFSAILDNILYCVLASTKGVKASSDFNRKVDSLLVLMPGFGLLFIVYQFLKVKGFDFKKNLHRIVYTLPILPIIALLIWG